MGSVCVHDTTDGRKVYDMLQEEVPKATAEASSAGGKRNSMAADWNAALLEGDKAFRSHTRQRRQNTSGANV